MSNIALIDGDEILYHCALRYQRTLYQVKKEDKVLWTCENKQSAIESCYDYEDVEIEPIIDVEENPKISETISNSISRILFHTNCTDIRVFLTGSDNFRYSLATLLPYKGNRDESTRPFYYNEVKDELRNRGAETVSFLEADDCMSAYASILRENTVICSSDKDLLTVPSLNFNIGKGVLSRVTEDEARRKFWLQVLIGDSTDNIPSPYLLGEVTANKLLDSIGVGSDYHYYQGILKTYESYLKAIDPKTRTYKTRWYIDCKLNLEDIIWEIGNLLYMHRTLNPEERWLLPE